MNGGSASDWREIALKFLVFENKQQCQWLKGFLHGKLTFDIL